VSTALGLAHQKGIVHRDIKPANLFIERLITSTGEVETVKLVDFGVAGMAENDGDNRDQRLTSVGAVFGSPLYMSPEQILGNSVSSAADIYSCGCALFETLTGAVPFRGTSAIETMQMHVREPLPRLCERSNGVFSQRLEGLLAGMLAKDPHSRIQTFSKVEKELALIAQALPKSDDYSETNRSENLYVQSIQTGQSELSSPQRSPRVGIVIFASLAIVLIALVAFGTNLASHKVSKQGDNTVVASKSTNRVMSATAPVSTAVPESVPQISHYLTGVDKAKGLLIFDFPANQSLGNFNWYKAGPDNHATNIAAQGRRLIPIDAYISLFCGNLLSQSPALFDGFGPNDLYIISLDKNFYYGDKHLHYISALTGLKGLLMTKCDVTDGCFSDLNRLKNLRQLNVKQTDLTGRMLARLSYLKNLHILNASGIKDISEVITALRDTHTMHQLEIDQTDIRDDDLKVIATIDSLEALSLSANKRVTAAGLSALAVLPRLRALEIGELTVPAEDLIVVLKKFKRLDSLTVGNGDWTTAEVQPFEKSLNIRVIKHPIARVIVRATEVPEVLHSLGGKK